MQRHNNKSVKENSNNITTAIAIIGAGPAGLFTAYLLAKNSDLSVTVFEEHGDIGLPVKCTGLVTNSIQKLVKIPSATIKNKIEFAKIISPSGKEVTIRLKAPNLVLDRARFDQFLAAKAVKAGAKIVTGSKFSFKDNNLFVTKGRKASELKTRCLIGADGPSSAVSKQINKGAVSHNFIGVQARVKLNSNRPTLEFYPFSQGFGWLVPESAKVTRIGIVSYKDSGAVFNKFLAQVARNHNTTLTKKNILDYQGGLIPIYNPKLKVYKKLNTTKAYLIGDAASHVKATTAGGIIQSLLAAKALARSIIRNKSYKTELAKQLTKDLKLHLLIRKAMDNFTDADYDYLFKLTNQNKIKQVLSDHDRDFILKFALKLFLKEPRYLYFVGKMVKP